MATITQRNGKWRVQIRMKGVSRSATFERASDAKAWAARIESQIMDGIQGNAPRNTIFADLIRRYLSEVTPSKRGAREESYRIGRALKTPLAKVQLADLRPQDFADWRDQRLQEVSPTSVGRELTTLSAICEHAMKEWGLLRENPVRKISKPKKAGREQDDQPSKKLPTFAPPFYTDLMRNRKWRCNGLPLPSYLPSKPPCGQAKSAA